MTNSTIPYSFIPGTKAKANEVNANFLSLADAIDQTKEYTQSQIESIQTKIDEDIEDLSDTLAKKDLSNTNQITNCIIAAPNGVAEYVNTEISVKQDLEVLIADGKNSDGTLKNIEYKVSEDIKYTPNMATETRELFLSSEGTISSYKKDNIYIGTIQPTIKETEAIWFNPSLNVWKSTTNTGNTWNECKVVKLATFQTDSSTITSMTTIPPVNILKYSDINQIIKCLTPDYTTGITIGNDHVCQYPCYLRVTGNHVGTEYRVYINGIDIGVTNTMNWGDRTYCHMSVYAYCDKGDVITFGGGPDIRIFKLKGDL